MKDHCVFPFVTRQHRLLRRAERLMRVTTEFFVYLGWMMSFNLIKMLCNQCSSKWPFTDNGTVPNFENISRRLQPTAYPAYRNLLNKNQTLLGHLHSAKIIVRLSSNLLRFRILFHPCGSKCSHWSCLYIINEIYVWTTDHTNLYSLPKFINFWNLPWRKCLLLTKLSQIPKAK